MSYKTPINQAVNNALAGTWNSPSDSNRFMTA